MKANRHSRGSVLMEFIIVFPIYLVLFGGVFMIGDMAIKTTRLASADRTRAFDVAATPRTGQGVDNSLGWYQIKDKLFPPSTVHVDDVKNEWYRHYGDPHKSFKGPWTVTVGAKVRDEYKLAPWTKGWLAFAKYFLGDATSTDFSHLGEIGSLMDGGQVAMYAKDINTPIFKNYSSFRRTRFYDSAKLKQRYRAMPLQLRDAGRLVDGVAGSASWNTMAGEEWPEVGTGTDAWTGRMPSLSSREYTRYSKFKTWSE